MARCWEVVLVRREVVGSRMLASVAPLSPTDILAESGVGERHSNPIVTGPVGTGLLMYSCMHTSACGSAGLVQWHAVRRAGTRVRTHWQATQRWSALGPCWRSARHSAGWLHGGEGERGACFLHHLQLLVAAGCTAHAALRLRLAQRCSTML